MKTRHSSGGVLGTQTGRSFGGALGTHGVAGQRGRLCLLVPDWQVSGQARNPDWCGLERGCAMKTRHSSGGVLGTQTGRSFGGALGTHGERYVGMLPPPAE